MCELNAKYSSIRYGIVGMATGIRARRFGVRNIVEENGFFSSSKCLDRLGGPPSFLFNGIEVIF